MNFTTLFLFFIGAVGVFNSLILSIYFLFFIKPKQITNILFGFFLLFFSERVLRSLVYFFNHYDLSNAYSRFEPVSFVFIGPFLFLYVVSVIKPSSKVVVLWKYHILFWVFIVIGIHFIFPYPDDPMFWKKYILKSINIQWLMYLSISAWFVFKQVKNTQYKQQKLTPIQLWIILLLIAVLILWLIYFFISFSYFITGSIVFSILFYSFYFFFLFKKKERALVFKKTKKYGDKKIEDSKATELIQKLEFFIKEQKPYKNADLKSLDIAKALDISTHQFSQLLNDNLGKSFSEFINTYRIEEAKRIIQFNTKYTLDAIGYESGFNSKTTFYNTFKRITGVTPAKYRAQCLSS